MKYIFLALAIFLMYKMIKGLLKKEAPEKHNTKKEKANTIKNEQ